jgi:hypothetical protein
MKKHFSHVLPSTGVLLLSLVPSFTNPVTATETKHPEDTAYYFNERGHLIWQQARASQPGCFVIKTRRQFQELYSDYLRSDSITVTDAKPYKPADVKSISRRLARKVEKLIREGKIYDPLVLDNVFEILDKETLHIMRSNIKGSCNDMDDASNYREYGGLVKDDGSISSFAGATSDPREFGGSTLHIRGTGSVEYHSHPAGHVECTEQSASDMVAGSVTITGSKSRTSERKYVAYIQAPSGVDQQAVGHRTGYVFGMSSRLIYVYDSEGVKATLPIAFAEKKLRKKAMPKNRMDNNASYAAR